jgi:transposase InsO family protein
VESLWPQAPRSKASNSAAAAFALGAVSIGRSVTAAEGITCSMSRSGDCWDSSVVESFFASLKKERVHRKTYATRDAARADVFNYIETFYNVRRRHPTLGQVSLGSSKRLKWA